MFRIMLGLPEVGWANGGDVDGRAGAGLVGVESVVLGFVAKYDGMSREIMLTFLGIYSLN